MARWRRWPAGLVDVAHPVNVIVSGTEGHAYACNNQSFFKQPRRRCRWRTAVDRSPRGARALGPMPLNFRRPCGQTRCAARLTT